MGSGASSGRTHDRIHGDGGGGGGECCRVTDKVPTKDGIFVDRGLSRRDQRRSCGPAGRGRAHLRPGGGRSDAGYRPGTVHAGWRPVPAGLQDLQIWYCRRPTPPNTPLPLSLPSLPPTLIERRPLFAARRLSGRPPNRGQQDADDAQRSDNQPVSWEHVHTVAPITSASARLHCKRIAPCDTSLPLKFDIRKMCHATCVKRTRLRYFDNNGGIYGAAISATPTKCSAAYPTRYRASPHAKDKGGGRHTNRSHTELL